MAVYLNPIWDEYVKHRNLDQLRDDVLTDPWYERPKQANESLLMRAAQDVDLGAVKLLISLGENPSLPSADGFSFLHIAVDQTSEADVGTEREAALAVLTALLEAGADPNVQGMDGTPLHRAAGAGMVEAARILLSFGADLEARGLVDGELTPLMHSALMGRPQMVQFLREAGANRGVISRPSLTDLSMTLRQLLVNWNVSHKDEILKLLDT